MALIVSPADLASLEYRIISKQAGRHAEITFARTSTTENLTNRFDGITSLNATNICLYADDAARYLANPIGLWPSLIFPWG